MVGQAHEREPLVEIDAVGAPPVHGDASGHGAAVADGLADDSSVSRQKRARFSNEPPYSSGLLWNGERNCIGRKLCAPYT